MLLKEPVQKKNPSESSPRVTAAHGRLLWTPLSCLCAHACSSVVSSQRLLNENSVWMDGLVAIWIMVKAYAAFQTDLLRGRAREKSEERVSEMSIFHGEQRHLFMHRLYCCEEAKPGWKPPWGGRSSSASGSSKKSACQ